MFLEMCFNLVDKYLYFISADTYYLKKQYQNIPSNYFEKVIGTFWRPFFKTYVMLITLVTEVFH